MNFQAIGILPYIRQNAIFICTECETGAVYLYGCKYPDTYTFRQSTFREILKIR